jgi:hypothetical protein
MEHAVDLHHESLFLGRYRPLKPLGSGGSGSVWLVRDERGARDVALKVIPREGKAGSRAEREVEAAARLRHPHCLRALALEGDERHVYVAYEYVAGQTLHQALRGGGVDDAAAVEAAAQVLEALAHAHSKGVVHRDVKPANIMLREGEGVSVRVLDFGLAHLDEADTLTAAGDVPGTLAYIAPERLAGEAATGAADVWAAGLVLWEALAGRHPFWAASPLETARRVQAGAPLLASARPDLQRALCAAVDGMLSLDPGRRPDARRAALLLRTAWERRNARPRASTSRTTLADRAGPAGLAALYAAGATLVLPFFPAGWSFLLGALALAATLASPRAGLALALAVPVLPLGNVSLGLALAYVPLAAAWLLLFARDTRSALLFVLGPLLAPVHALALVPVLVARARGALRRAVLAAVAVAASLAFAGLTRSPLPLTGDAPPLGLGLAGTESPHEAGALLAAAASAQPGLLLEALVFAFAAATVAPARRRGLWGVAVWGSAFLAAALLVPGGGVEVWPLVLGIWAAALLLGVPLLARR